jgi:hypothetical protein
MNDKTDIASVIGIVIVIVSFLSWIGFNIYTYNTKYLALSPDQICALQPITSQTEFCRDRINFFTSKEEPK